MKLKNMVDMMRFKEEKKLIPTRVSIKTIEETQKIAKKLKVPLTKYVDLALQEFNKKY